MGGKNVLKKSDLSYKQDDYGISHLYRLTVNADNTVKVEVDQSEIYSGNMKDDRELLKPKIIADPEDKKPGDWVDTSMMDAPGDWVDTSMMDDLTSDRSCSAFDTG